MAQAGTARASRLNLLSVLREGFKKLVGWVKQVICAAVKGMSKPGFSCQGICRTLRD